MTQHRKAQPIQLAVGPFLSTRLGQHRDQARSRGIDLVLTCQAKLGVFDPEIVGRILDNLLVNAIRLSNVLGTVPLALLKKGAGSMVMKIPVPPDRQAELAADFDRTTTRDMRQSLREYLKWLKSGEDHAALLCRSGVPTWVVHAEKGDGGLTESERRTLEECSTVKVVTIAGNVFFLPNEVPDKIATVINEAVAAVARR